jgi:hypothetical protein
MKKILMVIALSCMQQLKAQELFVFTEPASNMPAKSLGVRLSNYMMKDKTDNNINYHLLPEVMWGINKNLMIHVESFISNRNNSLQYEGEGLYAKYRFLSSDQVHSHFRMAAFGRMSFNNSDVHQEEIEINAHNTGYEVGIITTQLLHKVALSSTISYEQATDNGNGNKFPSSLSNNDVNYSFSIGKLILPKHYNNYKQVNLNIMLELLGQTLLQNGHSYGDAALAAQLIINSQIRIDVGYRQELYSTMFRTAPNGFIVRFEYLFFNFLGKKH